MKSLWIVNKYCGALQMKLHSNKSTGGLWLDAMLCEAVATTDEIVVVNIDKNVQIESLVDGRIKYYTLEGNPNDKYDYQSKKSILSWEKILDAENPDIIIAWGTEHPFVLAAMQAKKNIPVLIYAQGILKSIEKYYTAGLSKKEIRDAYTYRDIIKCETIPQMKKKYEKNAEYEKVIVEQAGNVLIENKWAEAYFKGIYSEVNAYFSRIIISEAFSNYRWSEKNMQLHTIMCPAADYPIKGLHMLLKALKIVKKNYPDVKLYIPGRVLKEGQTIKQKVQQRGYDRLIERMINEFELRENVTFTDRLSADKMAECMSKVNCFVMCSAIENHSSTLKEAMTVGVPSIASYVGGVPEYAVHNVNALLYRFEDFEVLAEHIIELFSNEKTRNMIASNALKTMNDYRKCGSSYLEMRDIMERIIHNC